MITKQEMINRRFSKDERTLVQLSDNIWKIGSVQEIKKRVSPQLFILHIGINVINLKAPFEKIISVFPEYTIYSNKEKTYYDIINFLQNTHFKVADERLNAIPPEQRKQMVHNIRKSLNELEDLTGAVWGTIRNTPDGSRPSTISAGFCGNHKRFKPKCTSDRAGITGAARRRIREGFRTKT